jgi:magnesium transporter
MALLREKAPDAETFYYVYVKDDEGRLKGVVSLRDLLTVPPDRRVEDFMRRDVISVNVNDDQETVAETMSRYNFLALPVVDDVNELKGIITVDDMIDVIREEAIEDLSHLGGLELAEPGSTPSLRNRLPSIAITLLGGLAAALLLAAFRERILSPLALSFFIPLVLRAAQDMSIVSHAVVLEEIGGKELGLREISVITWREMRVVALISLVLALSGGAISGLWDGNLRLGIAVGLSLFSAVSIGAACGIAIPIITRRFRGEFRYAQARFSFFLVGIAGIAAYLGIAAALL